MRAEKKVADSAVAADEADSHDNLYAILEATRPLRPEPSALWS